MNGIIFMIQEIVCPKTFKLKIDPEDIVTQNFPKKSGKITDKVKLAVTDLIHSVEMWQMIFIEASELRDLAEKTKAKSWRKQHKNDIDVKIHTEFDTYHAGAELRKDVSTENFEQQSVSWKNFFLNSKKKWRTLVATIYTISQTKKILLRKEIAENPIIAHNFLEFLSERV